LLGQFFGAVSQGAAQEHDADAEDGVQGFDIRRQAFRLEEEALPRDKKQQHQQGQADDGPAHTADERQDEHDQGDNGQQQTAQRMDIGTENPKVSRANQDDLHKAPHENELT